ncbi:putative inactive 1-aminocyclopropane-1-carboxylate synthase-like protein 2 [Araneus ventricosus]|uniref:Putative inactive 1-aminocyclopropane-1-carboxylate synthase-like protein 2 n=1 Tax=Araneus ventricosus TaxID=182803 RepID=A0A4Y2HG03_ARAVE|nr:putative inactive 1-aminocyclopropane-1-carboxylate synthase-like protein 2 [Araneus ventricosus]
MESADISKRAEVVRNWEDFLNKYMGICNNDEYDELNNPNGYINLGTGINNMCRDIIIPRLTSAQVWDCNVDLLQYREGYGILKLRKALATIMTEFLDTHEPVDPEDLICVVGVTACLDILAHCLADPGEAILAPTPIYGRIYTDFMQRSEVKLWPIPIISKENEELCPVLTIDKVKKAYDDAISQSSAGSTVSVPASEPGGREFYPGLCSCSVFAIICNEFDTANLLQVRFMVTSELSLTCCKLTASLHTCHDKFVANLHSCHDKFVASLLQTKIAIWV